MMPYMHCVKGSLKWKWFERTALDKTFLNTRRDGVRTCRKETCGTFRKAQNAKQHMYQIVAEETAHYNEEIKDCVVSYEI